MERQLANVLKEKGLITKQLREQYFDGWGFGKIRAYLAEIGEDPHTCIELESTEIALVTPEGIFMQIRNYDKECSKTFGLWGGVMECGETPEEGATRELKEETGLDITVTKEHFVEVNTHQHEYANGDKVLFHTYRYVINLDYVPEIVTDDESVGSRLLQGLVLNHQREFVRKILNGEI